MHKPIRVAITGATGQVSYSLLFRIACGSMFGERQPVEIRLIDIPQVEQALGGVVMELNDCAFPLVKGLWGGHDLAEGFEGVDWALLVGSAPRKQGMERGDLLRMNGGIFREQGQAIQAHAASDIRVVVVGNPCNTNCLIAMRNAPKVPQNRWFAMTRLDENRARHQLALKAGVPNLAVTNMAIWGNHSATQYPDFRNARIRGIPAVNVISDHDWLRGEFIETVQQRGAAIIKARGSSSAASAANAVVDTVHSLTRKTHGWDFHSVAVCSDGSYDVEAGLISSFPVRSDGRHLSIVNGVQLDDFGRARVAASVEELKSEREAVSDLL